MIKKHKTTDPVEIINKYKNITLIYVPLSQNINGYYKYISEKKQLIVINSNLDEQHQQLALFHELGHYKLKHKGRLLLNSPSISNIKEEYEADVFATYCFTIHNSIDKNNINNYLVSNRIKDLFMKIN